MRQLLQIFALTMTASLALAEQSEVATKLGYTNKSEMVSAGPYTLQYGESQDDSLCLLARGKHNIISMTAGDVDVYKKGLPWLSYKIDDKGNVSHLSMSVTDAEGKDILTMIDENADGQWDIKIDMVQKTVFVWRDGKWTPKEKK